MALQKGCAYAVVDEAEYAPEGDARYILCDDCLATLKQLALYHRRTLATPIIGITGTNGKTTTKELTAAVLQQKYNVLYTQGQDPAAPASRARDSRCGDGCIASGRHQGSR